MFASVLACFVDAAWLSRAVAKFHSTTVRALVPWATLGRIALAALLAAAVIVSPIWTDTLGFAGVVLASVVYLATFALLMKVLRVPEAEALFQSARKTMLTMLKWSRA
jgi:hypothetical protein